MTQATIALMAQLAAATRVGYSFDREFYSSEAVFAADMAQVIGRKWTMAGHVDQIKQRGDYFLFKIGAEQIIILRENLTSVRAFFNVCRHRGSVICTEDHGHKTRLTCPYHAWTYGLDGALVSARLMPEDFSLADNGLRACHVRVFHGLIFINLSPDAPEDFDDTFADLAPFLDFHGFAGAKIAHRAAYPTTANWKLVVENFLECYHCQPAHPEFCSLHPPEALIACGAGPSSGPAEAQAVYQPVLEAWEKHAATLGRPIGTVDDGPDSSHLRLLIQRTLREGFETETEDGAPASSLMGKRQGWDQGRMHLSFTPISHIVADNDFAILFFFTPRGPMQTDVELFWLVDAKAETYDVDKMIWAWDATTKQDKIITENNQAGILSSRYAPGRYSDQERRLITFQQWYLRQFGLVRAD